MKTPRTKHGEGAPSAPAAHRLLTLDDVEQAARVIAEAFVDDPLCSTMLPWRRTRMRTLRTFFRAYAEVMIKNQCGYGVGDPLQGAAFWLSPDRPSVSISIRSLGKFLPLLFTMYPIGMIRARAALRLIDALHEKYASEPHFYLDNLGVAASARGQGLSSRLIRPFLDLADALGVIAYTDTVTPANVPLYEHFGFACVEQAAAGGTGLTVYALRRGPHPPALLSALRATGEGVARQAAGGGARGARQSNCRASEEMSTEVDRAGGAWQAAGRRARGARQSNCRASEEMSTEVDRAGGSGGVGVGVGWGASIVMGAAGSRAIKGLSGINTARWPGHQAGDPTSD